MGSLATSLITILRRLRQSSGSFTLGNEFHTHRGGVLQLFIHKDAWRVLINKHICCRGHLGINYSGCSSCTCYSNRNVTVPISLVLMSTSISYALTFPAPEAFTIFFSLRACACVYVCERERLTDFGRACACQRGNNVNVTLRCTTPCLMIWFATAVSQALLLLSQCRAISSVVIAKQMKKKRKERKIETQVMSSSFFFFSVFKCFNISVVAKKSRK